MKLHIHLALVFLLTNAALTHAEPAQERFEVLAKYQVDGKRYSPEALKLVMPSDKRGCLQFPAPTDQPDRTGVYVQVEPTMKDGGLTYELEIVIGDTKEPVVVLSSSGDTFLGAPVKYSFLWQGKKFEVEIVFNRFKE